jgi:hypothetical protein
VDLDMMVKQVDDIAQLFLGVDVVRPDGLEGDKVMTEASSFLMRWFSSSRRVRPSSAGGRAMEWGTAVSLI